MKRVLCSVAALGMLAMLVLVFTLIGGCGGEGGAAESKIQSFSLAYNGNGNTGGGVPVDTTSYEQGQMVTVLGNTGNVTKSGYTFAGWNTQADGNGTTYAQGAIFSIGSADVTLFAKWTANPTYTVTYNGNGNTGGSIPTEATNYEQGQTVTVSGNAGNLVKSGYTFCGWNTQVDGLGTSYVQGQTFAVGSADVTLYAKWSANTTYTVTYDGNGYNNVMPVDSTRYEQGQIVTVLGYIATGDRYIYTFAGWNTQSDGKGTAYQEGTNFTMGSANVTLFAQWIWW